MVRDPKARIGRPRQIYTGMLRTNKYTPIENATIRGW
jgi:hypothetical protein